MKLSDLGITETIDGRFVKYLKSSVAASHESNVFHAAVPHDADLESKKAALMNLYSAVASKSYGDDWIKSYRWEAEHLAMGRPLTPYEWQVIDARKAVNTVTNLITSASSFEA